MKDEIRELLERQARWQKSREALSWPEKVRLVEMIRGSIVGLRGARAVVATPRPGAGVDTPDDSSSS